MLEATLKTTVRTRDGYTFYCGRTYEAHPDPHRDDCIVVIDRVLGFSAGVVSISRRAAHVRRVFHA